MGETGRQITLEALVVRVGPAVELCIELLIVAPDDCDEPFFLVDDALCILVDIRIEERRDMELWGHLLEELPVGIGLGDGARRQHPVKARAVLTTESHHQAVVEDVPDDGAAVCVAVVVGRAEEVLNALRLNRAVRLVDGRHRCLRHIVLVGGKRLRSGLQLRRIGDLGLAQRDDAAHVLLRERRIVLGPEAQDIAVADARRQRIDGEAGAEDGLRRLLAVLHVLREDRRAGEAEE